LEKRLNPSLFLSGFSFNLLSKNGLAGGCLFVPTKSPFILTLLKAGFSANKFKVGFDV
jgi:hypothetical protein